MARQRIFEQPMTPAERQRRRRTLLKMQQAKAAAQELEARFPGRLIYNSDGGNFAVTDAKESAARAAWSRIKADAQAQQTAWHTLGAELSEMRRTHGAEFKRAAMQQFPGITQSQIAGAIWFYEHAADLGLAGDDRIALGNGYRADQ